MISVNKATIIGRIGRDPEKRNFSNGGAVVSFSVATTESWKDKSGERKEATEWHDVQIFNETKANFIAQYAKKGDLVMVEGKMKKRKYQDKDGNDRVALEIVVQPFFGDVQLHSSDRDGEGGGRGSSDATARGTAGAASRQGPVSTSRHMDDDIPF